MHARNGRTVTAGILLLTLGASMASAQAQQSVRLALPTSMPYVPHIAFTADGKQLITVGALGEVGEVGDVEIRRWDIESAAELLQLRVAGDSLQPLYEVAISADGNSVAAGYDSVVYVWNSRTGEKAGEVRPASDDFFNGEMSLSANGQLLARISGDFRGGRTGVWRVSDMTMPRRFPRAAILKFSTGGRAVAVAAQEIVVWNARTWSVERTIEAQFPVTQSAVSDDGRVVAVAADVSFYSTAPEDRDHRRIWLYSLDTGRLIRELNTADAVGPLRLSADGSGLVASVGSSILYWSQTATEPTALWEEADRNWHTAISPDGRLAAIGGFGSILLVDLPTNGKRVLGGATSQQSAVAISANGDRIITASVHGNVFTWDTASGRRIAIAHPHDDNSDNGRGVNSLAFSPDGVSLLSAGDDGTVRITSTVDRFSTRTLKARVSEAQSKAAFSRDGRFVCSYGLFLSCWNSAGEALEWTRSFLLGVKGFAWSPATDDIVVVNDTELEVRDVSSGAVKRKTKYICERLCLATFAARGRLIVFSQDLFGVLVVDEFEPDTLRRRRVAEPEGTRLAAAHTLTGGLRRLVPPEFSTDGRRVAMAVDSGRTVELWDSSAVPWRRLGAYSQPSFVNSLALSADASTLVTGSDDGATRVWDMTDAGAANPRVVLASTSTGPNQDGWIVVDPEGRYDAHNPGSPVGVHWVADNQRIIRFEQLLMSRFYEPGLLAKIWRRQRLGDVGGGIQQIAPPPEVARVEPAPDGSSLRIDLRNTGGGLGAVVVKVNGRELPVPTTPPDAGAQSATVSVDLADAVWDPSGKNSVEVVAFDGKGNSTSAPRGVVVPRPAASAAPPEFYALLVGTSRFSGADTMNLQFAAHDAATMAEALRIGASRLVGAASVHITLLTSDADAEVNRPTKRNILRAFRDIAEHAAFDDTVLVYFAGHGLTYDKDRYHYLTQDARTLDLSDAVLRELSTVNSDELRAWLQTEIKAKRQVVILDTCAAGAASADLIKLSDKRELSGDQLRALALLQKSAGSVVLMGSAADKVSYEASRYAQGLLTYALLAGMKGEVPLTEQQLRVSEWFGYVVNKVQELARDIGGVQQPLLSMPRATNFPVALLTESDKQQIPLAAPRPQVLQPLVVDRSLGDGLKLRPTLRARLRDLGRPVTRGGEPGQGRVVYLDNVVDDLPGAIMPRIQYEATPDGIRATLVLLRDSTELLSTVLMLPTDANAAAAQLADRIVNAATEGR